MMPFSDAVHAQEGRDLMRNDDPCLAFRDQNACHDAYLGRLDALF